MSSTSPGRQERSDAEPQAEPSSRDGGSGTDFPLELRQRLTERDPEALAALFDGFFDRIYAYVRRMVRDEATSEDLTQDVFLHVHRSLPSYDPARPLSPWLYTIATNKVRDHWRSRRHHEEARMVSVDQEDAPMPPSPEAAPAAGLELLEVSGEVANAVAELPEMLRETFVLRYYEERSFEEIGTLVDRNEAAVRKRYSRALGELREALGHLVAE